MTQSSHVERLLKILLDACGPYAPNQVDLSVSREVLDYDTVAEIRASPRAPRACAAVFFVTDQAKYPFHFNLENIERVSRHFEPPPPFLGLNGSDVAVFVEPQYSFTDEQVRSLIQAVIAGRVELRVGLAFGRIIGVDGQINIDGWPLKLIGTGLSPSIAAVLGWVGLGRVERVRFVPWSHA